MMSTKDLNKCPSDIFFLFLLLVECDWKKSLQSSQWEPFFLIDHFLLQPASITASVCSVESEAGVLRR